MKINGKRTHSRGVTLYELRRGVTVVTGVKNIQKLYQAAVLRKAKRNDLKNSKLVDDPRSDRSSSIDDDVMPNSLQNNPRISKGEDVTGELFYCTKSWRTVW